MTNERSRLGFSRSCPRPRKSSELFVKALMSYP